MDFQSDQKLVEALTTALEIRVTARLTNATFKIWRDTDGLRTGDRWNDRIADALTNSQIFFVLLTPKWMESEYCRKEYEIFRGVEATFGIGEYVAPLLARTLDTQVKHFDEGQKETYLDLKTRQYAKTLAKDFLKLTDDERTLWIDKLADDIEAMIERLRAIKLLPPPQSTGASTKHRKTKKEFDARAHNFQDVDFLSAAEVVVARGAGITPRPVFAYVCFLPRMYIQATNARIEFGIRRAILSIEDTKRDGGLSQNEDWRGTKGRNAYYITSRSTPNAITICIDPVAGQLTLEDLPLPPSNGENRYAKVAYAPTQASHTDLKATISVSLCPEGIFIFSNDENKPNANTLKKIAAVVGAAAAKELSASGNHLQRQIVVKERGE